MNLEGDLKLEGGVKREQPLTVSEVRSKGHGVVVELEDDSVNEKVGRFFHLMAMQLSGSTAESQVPRVAISPSHVKQEAAPVSRVQALVSSFRRTLIQAVY